jgi:hypothetical protein
MDREEKAALDELFKAAERLGKTPDDCMRWVLKFAQADLKQYSEGQWADLCTEIEIFGTRGPLLRIGKRYTHLGPAFDWGGAPPEESRPQKKWITLTFTPSCKQVTALQKETARILAAFSRGGDIKFELGPLHIYLESWRTHKGGFSFKTHTPVDAFCFHLALLFSHYYGRIRACGECATVFLSDRRNQHYCTTRCLSRVTQRRWRERHMKKKRGKTIKRSKRQARAKGGPRHGTKRRS